VFGEGHGACSVADSGRRMVAVIMVSVDILVLTLTLARPHHQNLTMLQGHRIVNCSIEFCRTGRKFKLWESRSPTQIFQRNLVPACHQLWAYVCVFGLGLMEIIAMAMVLEIVIVIIVPEVLRQVGLLHQHQHHSFFILRAFY
jgi:hypothetical protein